MLYARFLYPNNGYSHDRETVSKSGLEYGKRYAVSSVDIGQSYTCVKLEKFERMFNSVYFEFELGDGTPHDIFSDPEYNTYLRARLIRRGLL